MKKLTVAEYDADLGVRSSDLKLAYESLAKFKAKRDGLIPRKESDAFDIGTAAHSAILEQNFDSHIEGPDAAKNTKVWKDFEAKHPDKICLQPHHFAVIKGMYKAFFAHPLAGRITNKGMPELSFFTEIRGQRYKARTDYLVEDSGGLYIVDYKTAYSAEYEDFQKAIENYGYDLSAAHYIRVVESVIDERPVNNYFWIVQEKEAPFEIMVYRMDDECRERSLQIVDSLYAKIEVANKTNVWPSKFPGEIMEIDVNYYAIQKGLRDV